MIGGVLNYCDQSPPEGFFGKVECVPVQNDRWYDWFYENDKNPPPPLPAGVGYVDGVTGQPQPEKYFDSNEDNRIIVCDNDSECGNGNFCQKINFNDQDILSEFNSLNILGVQVLMGGGFNRVVEGRVREILNLSPEVNLVDVDGQPLVKICMPHSRCLVKCVNEGEELGQFDRCCEGLIAGSGTCYDPARTVMTYPDRIRFEMDSDCKLRSIDIENNENQTQQADRDDLNNIVADLCSTPGHNTKADCENADGVWLLPHILKVSTNVL